MKILDNKKDYYDYLMGVYGIDDKVVYDRRGSVGLGKDVMDCFDKNGDSWACRVWLKVGDWVYVFMRKGIDEQWSMPDTIRMGRFFDTTDYPNPMPYAECKAKIPDDAPIVMLYEISLKKHERAYERPDGVINFSVASRQTVINPILSNFAFIKKFVKPEEIWNKIYDYLSNRNEPAIVDTRTDIQHLESAGFDKKTSFRRV